MPALLYSDDLVLCSESDEDLKAMVGRFVEVCRRKGLKVNAGKCKVMVLGGEELGTDETGCSRKVANGRRTTSAIRSLINARSL